jgi:hypothetical protein
MFVYMLLISNMHLLVFSSISVCVSGWIGVIDFSTLNAYGNCNISCRILLRYLAIFKGNTWWWPSGVETFSVMIKQKQVLMLLRWRTKRVNEFKSKQQDGTKQNQNKSGLYLIWVIILVIFPVWRRVRIPPRVVEDNEKGIWCLGVNIILSQDQKKWKQNAIC